MHILHLSDPHLRGDGGLSFRVVDTKYWVDVAARHVAALPKAPDVVVMTGDLADNGDPRAYTILREAFSFLRCPVYVVPGNHDRRDHMQTILGSWAEGCPEVPGRLCRAVEYEGLRLLFLDTLEPGSHSGHFTPAMEQWLERELAEHSHKPALLFMHHPPFITGMGMMDEPFEGYERLAACVRKAPLARLCCGHMHRPITTEWEGRIAMTAPSISMQIELDLRPEGGDEFRMETPGYLWHHWDGVRLNSHVCQFPVTTDFSGPHRFIGSENPTED